MSHQSIFRYVFSQYISRVFVAGDLLHKNVASFNPFFNKIVLQCHVLYFAHVFEAHVARNRSANTFEDATVCSLAAMMTYPYHCVCVLEKLDHFSIKETYLFLKEDSRSFSDFN